MNSAPDDQPRLLVCADRELGEALPERLAEEFPGVEVAGPYREALAGEDDAEDAQWILELRPANGPWTGADLRALERIAAEDDAWLES